jgi:hypothetical protein
MIERNEAPLSANNPSRRQVLFAGLGVAASVPLFSSWKREAKKKLPWRREVFLQDIAAYAERGIRHVTSFAVYMDADYVRQYGEPPLDEYSKELQSFRKP